VWSWKSDQRGFVGSAKIEKDEKKDNQRPTRGEQLQQRLDGGVVVEWSVGVEVERGRRRRIGKGRRGISRSLRLTTFGILGEAESRAEQRLSALADRAA
jgi:hypothetical protein